MIIIMYGCVCFWFPLIAGRGGLPCRGGGLAGVGGGGARVLRPVRID